MGDSNQIGKCPGCGCELPPSSEDGPCCDCLAQVGFESSRTSTGGYFPEEEGITQFAEFDSLSQIGMGGMGVVFRAYERSLDRHVALKLMSDTSPKAAQQFRIGAEAAAKLDHPHIVPIFSYGKHNDRLFLSMKLVEGESLKKHISRGDFVLKSPSSEGGKALQMGRQREIARLILTIARAVHHAHENGVVHRDLKPANILIDAENRPQLVDFGLAKVLDGREASEASGVMGTVPYMSPEQAKGEPAREPSDIYSLGVVFYELLSGRVPFIGKTPVETMRKVASEEPKFLRSGNLSIDRDLETICLKCLEKNPGHRYGTAGFLAEDLERWLDGKPILVRPVGRAARVWKWVKRNRLGSMLIISLFSGLLVSVVLLLYAQYLKGKQEDFTIHILTEWQKRVRKEWGNPGVDRVEIDYGILGIMGERDLPRRADNDHEFILGLFATPQDQPEVVALDYAELTGFLERCLGEALGRTALIGLRFFKHQQFGGDFFQQANRSDLLEVSLADYLRFQDRLSSMKPILIGPAEPAVIMVETNLSDTTLEDLKRGDLTFATENETLHFWVQAHLLLNGFEIDKVTNASPINPESSYHLVQHLKRGHYKMGILPNDKFVKYSHIGVEKVFNFDFDYPPVLLLAQTNLAPSVIKVLKDALINPKLNVQLKKQSHHRLIGMRLVPQDYLSKLIETYRKLPRVTSSAKVNLPALEPRGKSQE